MVGGVISRELDEVAGDHGKTGLAWYEKRGTRLEGGTVLHRMAATFGAHVDDAEAARQGEVELIGVVVLRVLGQNPGEDPVCGEGIVAEGGEKVCVGF